MVGLKLKLVEVKTADEASVTSNVTATDGGVKHVTQAIKELVDPWEGEIYWVVAADSYFSSVKYDESLEETGLGFIGVINKTPYQY